MWVGSEVTPFNSITLKLRPSLRSNDLCCLETVPFFRNLKTCCSRHSICVGFFYVYLYLYHTFKTYMDNNSITIKCSTKAFHCGQLNDIFITFIVNNNGLPRPPVSSLQSALFVLLCICLQQFLQLINRTQFIDLIPIFCISTGTY